MDVSHCETLDLFLFITYHPFLFLLYGHLLTHFIHRYLITATVLTHTGPGDYLKSPSIDRPPGGAHATSGIRRLVV